MEKHTSEKKKGLKWILLAAGILVLAAAVGLGLWFLLGNQQEQVSTEQNHVDIYWNVDRMDYVAGNTDGTSGRYPRGDGYYYIRLAANGEQEDYMVEQYALVNRIDLLDYFVPVFDENNVIVDIKTVEECTGGLVAPALYVEAMEGNKIIADTQGTYLGVDITFEIDEETEVYSVGGGSILAGIPAQIQLDDAVIAIKDLDGTIGTVFVEAYEPVGDIYWNIHRKYNSSSKTTTRDPDALGYYNFEMALNGEVVTVRTKDYDIANDIDKQGAKCMSLTFDENGDVSGRYSTSAAGTNGTFGSWYHVTGLTDKTVTAERIAAGAKQGDIMTATFAPNCKIIDVSAMGGYSGAYTELRVGDQIHGLLDQRGRVAYIFVHVRLSDETMPLYWNVARKYSSTTGTTRTPDANGWYYAEVTTGGNEPITVKTQDKALMDSLDSYAARCFTMRLKGDNEIALIGSAGAAHGGGTFGSWYYVDSVEGDKITVSRILSGASEPTVVTGTLSPDLEVINGSTNVSSHCGEYTELQVGDRVHGLTDLRKQVRVLFVVDRPIDGDIYWNLTRGYNSTTKETTKTPDADGFYWFTFAVNGKQQTLKTRSKEIATKIDSAAARCWGLRTWNGEITEVLSTSSLKGYTGGTKSVSWVTVQSVEGQYVVAKKIQSGHAQDGKIFNVYLGNNCKIYDVSNGYTEYAGEPTTLREGDMIHAFHNGDGIAMLVWVVGGRTKPVNTQPNECPCAEGVTWQDWDGTTELEDGGYYSLTADVTAPTEGFYLENKTIYLRLNGHTISSDGRCFYTYVGGNLSICDHGTRGKLVGTGVSGESGGVIRMYTANNASINLWNIDVVCNADSTPAKEGGAISCSGPMTLHNVNVIGGTAATKGGNVQLSTNGTLRMFGGSLQNGNAKGGAGGNINADGVLYLENVTVSGGKASGSGENMNIGSNTLDKQINGLTVTGGDVRLAGGELDVQGKLNTNLTLEGDAKLVNLGVDSASSIKLTMKNEGTVLANAETDLSGIFANMDTTGDYVIRYDSKGKAVVMDCTIVPVEHTGDHCACAGADSGIADHMCSTLSGWTEITADVFESAIGTNSQKQGVKFIQDGNYYLSVNYTLPGVLCVMPDQNITICLNGNQLRNTGRCSMIAGNLTITDCTGEGQVYSTGNNTNGNTFKVLAGGELNIYGGTVTAKSSCSDGGVICVSQDKGNLAPADSTEPGVCNIYGGTVTGGSATNGGNIIVWHTSVLNMYGGTVSNGTATSGENISIRNVNATANLLGGKITNGNVHMSSGKVCVGGSVEIEKLIAATVAVSEKGLKSDASITMTAPAAGTLVTGVDDSNYKCFNFVEIGNGIEISYESAENAIIAEFQSTHNHCVCGGVSVADHSCSTEGWMPLNAETVENYFTVASSRYELSSDELYLYLTEDLDLSYSINLLQNKTIHLCLNGHKLKHTKTANPVMRVWGNLDITDCSSGRSGSIIGSRTGESPCLYIQNWKSGTIYTTPVVNLYAGTLTADDGNTSSKAGVCQIGNKANSEGNNYATFNMYGGTICGGDANNGGNIYMESVATVFNMYGGTITDGNATGNGGGIYVTSLSATVNILGGTITGNTAGSLGNDLYTTSAPNVTLGGTVKIGEYYSNAIVLKLQNLNAASSVNILRNPDAPATFATGADTDVAKCFTNPTMTAVWDETEKTLTFVAGGSTPEPPAEETGHKHCLCADATGVSDTHTCTDTGFVELTQSDFDNAAEDSSPVYKWMDGSTTRYSLRAGAYYLGEDITIKNCLTLQTGESASLCLNGKSLTGSGCRTIYTKGTLNITDCAYTTNTDGAHTYSGSVKITNFTLHAPTLYARSDSVVNIYGGNIVGTKLASSVTTGGGTVAVSGTLNIYDGKITGGDASDSSQPGGNMVIMDNAIVNMYGGSMEGGKATGSSGGNVRVAKGTFNMYGGKISGGNAKEGGNVAIASNQTFNLYDGTIENGNATSYGGNVMVFGKLNVMGGTIRNGVSGSMGGNICNYANTTNIKISGGLIADGKAPNGANICMRSTTSVTVYLTITGGTIQGVQSGSGKSVHITNNAKVVTSIGGNAVIDELYLAGESAVLTVSTDKPLTAAASIAISAAGEQTVVKNLTTLTGLKAADSDYELYVSGSDVAIITKA